MQTFVLPNHQIIQTLQDIAEATAPVVKQYFRRSGVVEIKRDKSVVTEADKLCEVKARAIIAERFPDHGIIGEEFGTVQSESQYQWVIDPIDGTTSFIAGSFDFGTVVGFLADGIPSVGMVAQPILGEVLIGDNEQVTLNGEPLPRITESRPLSEAIIGLTDFFLSDRFQDGERFFALAREAKAVRTWGNAYGYALLAMGLIDVMIDPVVSVWDIAGVVPVVQGAGCTITDYHGNPFHLRMTSVIAARPELHKIILEKLRSSA